MEKQTKRYLVTYADGDISTEEAVNILGVPKAKFKEGVSFMASEATPAKADVMHFEKMGVSSINLTEEEAGKLSRKEKVLAVEEDIEMYAIGAEQTDEAQFMELFTNENEPNGSDGAGEDMYLKGYKKASLDIFSSLLDAHTDMLLSNVRSGEPSDQAVWPPVLIPKTPIRKYPWPPILRQPTPWNISMVNAPTAWARGTDGRGVNVAILDTGIASHPDLVLSGGVSFVPGTTSFDDHFGHGTHCAGIVAARNNIIGVVGVAPAANLYAVKVLNDNGSGNSSWIIAGLEWCVSNGIKVASMSLGGASDPMTAYAYAIKRCQDNGVTVVVAAGNSYGSGFPWVCSPANSLLKILFIDIPTARPIAVGAVDSGSAIAGFSSRGGRTADWNQVNSVAPGVSINSTYLGNGYKVMSGTSMACPHVAGLAALITQRYPGITPYNVKRRITTTSKDLGTSGYDITYGYGLINCDLATR